MYIHNIARELSCAWAMPSRERCQKVKRRSYAKIIYHNIFKKLSSKQHRKRLTTTNRLFPPGTLRRRCLRNTFAGWVLQFVGQGRILTQSLAQDVCKHLRANLEMADHEDGVQELEAKRLHQLLKAARKRQLRPLAMSSMDQLETLPMPPAFWEENHRVQTEYI